MEEREARQRLVWLEQDAQPGDQTLRSSLILKVLFYLLPSYKLRLGIHFFLGTSCLSIVNYPLRFNRELLAFH